MAEMELATLICGEIAGTLRQDEHGLCSFVYAPTYRGAPLSLTMPLYKQTYTSKTLFPFFDGLIPEGWLLQVVSRNWKINIQDRFGLLIVSCKDCIGNVSIKEVKE